MLFTQKWTFVPLTRSKNRAIIKKQTDIFPQIKVEAQIRVKGRGIKKQKTKKLRWDEREKNISINTATFSSPSLHSVEDHSVYLQP